MTRVQLLEVIQPIGAFYLGVLNADIINKITNINRREENGGIQRRLSASKVKEIKSYCENPDATFPTPIIIALYLNGNYSFDNVNNILEINGDGPIGEIIDGQHRVAGIGEAYNRSSFNLPVVFMFNLTEEEKAYVFSTINSKQTKVSMSLIYDLFSISENRSPQKTCHEIARLLNTDYKSPFYNRLKMLGTKEGEFSSLSQGSFINYLIPLLSKDPVVDMNILKYNPSAKLLDDPKLPFRYYFINNQDENIYKILLNLFLAVKSIFPIEWENHNKFILSKTTGYGALLKAFPNIYELGLDKKSLDIDFFKSCLICFKDYLEEEELELTSSFFPSNGQGQKKLAEVIELSLQKII